MARAPVKILGVDTSLRSTGVGVIISDGIKHRATSYGTIKGKRSWPLSECLNYLYRSITELIEEENPELVAIEGIFYCRNVKTAIILGQARGAAIAACSAKGLPIYELSPRSVKKGIVGRGAASKDQVGQMVKNVLGLKEIPQEDAADALAIALAHAHTLRLSEELGPKTI